MAVPHHPQIEEGQTPGRVHVAGPGVIAIDRRGAGCVGRLPVRIEVREAGLVLPLDARMRVTDEQAVPAAIGQQVHIE